LYNGPAQKNPAVLGTGEVHAQQENQVGQTIGHRATDHYDGGIAIVDGRDAQKGNQGPTDDIAEGDGRYTGNHPQVRPSAKGAQVCPLGKDRFHQPGSGKPDE
jgi:hypothetical protein